MLKIHGVPVSPHTRKVIIAALLKDLPYEVRPVIPMKPPEDFAAISPLGKIPVLSDGTLNLPDSSVICAYLEAKYPKTPRLFPKDPVDYARSLWIEEYVDGGLVQDVIGIVFQKVIRPKILDQATDHAIIDSILKNSLPKKLDYLEGSLDGSYFVADQLTIADVAVASSLVSLHYAGQRLQGASHPRLSGHFRRMLQSPAFTKALADEQTFADHLGLDRSFLN